MTWSSRRPCGRQEIVILSVPGLCWDQVWRKNRSCRAQVAQTATGLPLQGLLVLPSSLPVPHMLHCVVIAVYVSVAPPAWEPHGSDRILFIPWHARGDSPHGLNWKTPRVPAQGKLVTLVSWGFELKLFYISCSRGSLGVLKWVFYSKSLPMSAVG